MSLVRYGGSDGQWPWAVMGSDDSLREYAWGKAITDLPAHSEMPAVRDLLLQAVSPHSFATLPRNTVG